jgi:hypothetical protein
MIGFDGFFGRPLLPGVLSSQAHMREEMRDCAHCLSATLSEHHSRIFAQILRVFDEAEKDDGFVSRSQMFFGHLDDGCCLPDTSNVH